MRAIKIIAGREFGQTVHGKAYRITTVLGLLGLIALSFLPTLINWLDQKNMRTVVVADTVGGIYEEIEASVRQLGNANEPIQFTALGQDIAPTKSALDREVNAGHIKAYLLITPSTAGKLEPLFELGARQPSSSLIRAVEQALRPIVFNKRLADLHISPQEAARLQAPVLSKVSNVDNRYANDKAAVSSQALVYLLLFLLYLTLIGYGSVLTHGVTAEKSSRVMEMMLVSVQPTDLLMGKILGLGAASLLQYAIWVIFSLCVSWARGAFDNLTLGGVPLQISAVAPSTILYFLLYYALGYFAYSALFAAAGCLVNRSEESSQTLTPVMILMVSAYMIAVMTFANPTGTAIRVASLIPFLTPMVMFTRIVMSDVPLLDILLSVAFSLVFIWLTVSLGGRIYRHSVLRTRRTGWLEGLRGARN